MHVLLSTKHNLKNRNQNSNANMSNKEVRIAPEGLPCTQSILFDYFSNYKSLKNLQKDKEI